MHIDSLRQHIEDAKNLAGQAQGGQPPFGSRRDGNAVGQ